MCHAVHNGSGGKIRNQKICQYGLTPFWVHIEIPFVFQKVQCKPLCLVMSSPGQIEDAVFLALEITLKVDSTRYHYLKKVCGSSVLPRNISLLHKKGPRYTWLSPQINKDSGHHRWSGHAHQVTLDGAIPRQQQANSKTDFCYEMDVCLLPAY